MELKAKVLSGEVKLPVAFLREGKSVIAYTPALDLSTSGKNIAQAKKRFAEIVRIFLKDLAENNTLEPVLLGLGWTKGTKRKESNTWVSPQRILSQEEIRVPVNAQRFSMGKIGKVSWQKFERFLLKIGCEFIKEEGDHRKYRRPGLLRPVIVPRDRDLPSFIIHNNLRTLGISKEDYLRIMKDIQKPCLPSRQSQYPIVLNRLQTVCEQWPTATEFTIPSAQKAYISACGMGISQFNK